MNDGSTSDAHASSEAGEQPLVLLALDRVLALVMPRPDAVARAIGDFDAWLRDGETPSDARADVLVEIAHRAAARTGDDAALLARLVLDRLPESTEPWRDVTPLLEARNGRVAREALRAAATALSSGGRTPDDAAIRALARGVGEGGAFADAEGRALVARALGASGGEEGLAALLTQGVSHAARQLAAALLDARGEPASDRLARAMLGDDAHEFLARYLRFTRATHADLLALAGRGQEVPPALASLRRAETALGEEGLRLVLATVGWPRVNLGLAVEERVGLSVGGAFPLLLERAETTLFAGGPSPVGESRVVFERTLVVAHGGTSGDAGAAEPGSDPLARFRSYNVAHAAALAEILDVAPLDHARVSRLIELLDRLVDDYGTLFAAHDASCRELPALWHALRAAIEVRLRAEEGRAVLSSDTTRLVLLFEDPMSLSAVTTLHGLKRFLHQRGLKLAFSLFESGRTTNRTVDLLVLEHGRVVRHAQPLRYVDVDVARDPAGDVELLPYPVHVVADGFARQLLHGREALPACDAFCYGNEVHYYVRFRNHPVFIRIDFAPPVQGGMVDLQYYGVSQYELELHPNLELDGIRVFLRQLDFDARVEDLRVHARYDKERARGLDDLCAKIEALFRLVPYMMEIDWTISSLRYSTQARQTIAAAWALCFARWGVLPVEQLLTRDRAQILLAMRPGAEGDVEVPWAGRGAYQDRFSERPAEAIVEAAIEALRRAGISFELPAHEAGSALGQIDLERVLLRPLRAASRRGEIVVRDGRFTPQAAALFQRVHESAIFAELVHRAGPDLARAARLARVVPGLVRTLRFTATGAVNGWTTEKARLVLRGSSLGVYVLRDEDGVPQLAIYGPAETLSTRRESERDPWRDAWSTELEPFLDLLRDNAYLGALEAWSGLGQSLDTDAIAARLLISPHDPAGPPAREERLLSGLRASPGRAVGQAVLGIDGRHPSDVAGGVLVVPAMRPQDNAFLYRASGIVSTGGGVLSHAGLLANQFGKPALVVEGRWEERDGSLALRYEALEYEEDARDHRGFRIVARTRIRRREEVLREGDLLVLDADVGVLRILGQSQEALSLHENLQQLALSDRALQTASDAPAVLALRGRRLKACHQLDKVLRRLTDPTLARHAVHELLWSAREVPGASREDDRARLLLAVLENEHVGVTAREQVRGLTRSLRLSFARSSEEARRFIARAGDLGEVLGLRLEAYRAYTALLAAEELGTRAGIDPGPDARVVLDEIDTATVLRIDALRAHHVETVQRLLADPKADRAGCARHEVRALLRLEEACQRPRDEHELVVRAVDALARGDRQRVFELGERLVLGTHDGGLALQPLAGWKAANLAEVARLVPEANVPAWFVVTNAAFRLAMSAEVDTDGDGRRALRDAIERVLARSDFDDVRRAQEVDALWEALVLPASIEKAIATAYEALGEPSEHECGAFVAVRSSGLEEDTESRSRAGEFETFLFVRGRAEVLRHVKRAWASLWTERAIHNRRLFALDPVETGGGVLVQRMVRARVSGVVQTINPAGGRYREMVINAGYGLGEGIVSGTVAADQIIVLKDDEPGECPLAVRYATADKLEQIVFDDARGQGTRRVEVPYHQRLRGALEYVELAELVEVARALERGYGYPLNLEFALEDTTLRILQARPVAGAANVFALTRERHPLPEERHR